MSDEGELEPGQRHRDIAEADLATLRDGYEAFEREIAGAVRRLRTERSWSQQDLADRITRLGWPMDQAAVSRLEAGRRPIRAAEMQALATAFGVPVAVFLYLPAPGEPPSAERVRKRLQAVDDRIEQLRKDTSASLSVYAEAMREREVILMTLSQAAANEEAGSGEHQEAP